jgi:hypothetical protein
MLREEKLHELATAYSSTKKFVERMKEDAHRREKAILDEAAVMAALKLCGLWPLCR